MAEPRNADHGLGQIAETETLPAVRTDIHQLNQQRQPCRIAINHRGKIHDRILGCHQPGSCLLKQSTHGREKQVTGYEKGILTDRTDTRL